MTPAFTSATQRRLYVFFGAGLSAESGISTFRTGDGLWTKARIEEVCDFTTWRQNRAAVFDFYNARIEQYRDAQPNEAHQILARWQREWGAERVVLLTQNIDDLLERAGAREVVHLHGDMHTLLCTQCDLKFPRPGEFYDAGTACPSCGEVQPVKPGVVFFHEAAPAYIQLHRMRVEIAPRDVFLAIGTTFEVVGTDRMLPYGRRDAHPGNFLIDPVPRSTWSFGNVRAMPATDGLRDLEGVITRLMSDSVSA